MTDVRLIDANALLELYTPTDDFVDIHAYKVPIPAVVQNILDQPTLDYAPVRHGEWVWNGFDGIGWECSLCKHEESKEAKKPEASYCPNCGAKMDGGK